MHIYVAELHLLFDEGTKGQNVVLYQKYFLQIDWKQCRELAQVSVIQSL